jgi:hypothetical protein
LKATQLSGKKKLQMLHGPCRADQEKGTHIPKLRVFKTERSETIWIDDTETAEENQITKNRVFATDTEMAEENQIT